MHGLYGCPLSSLAHIHVTLKHELLTVSIFQHEPSGGVSAEMMEAENARLGRETVDTTSGNEYA